MSSYKGLLILFFGNLYFVVNAKSFVEEITMTDCKQCQLEKRNLADEVVRLELLITNLRVENEEIVNNQTYFMNEEKQLRKDFEESEEVEIENTKNHNEQIAENPNHKTISNLWNSFLGNDIKKLVMSVHQLKLDSEQVQQKLEKIQNEQTPGIVDQSVPNHRGIARLKSDTQDHEMTNILRKIEQLKSDLNEKNEVISDLQLENKNLLDVQAFDSDRLRQKDSFCELEMHNLEIKIKKLEGKLLAKEKN